MWAAARIYCYEQRVAALLLHWPTSYGSLLLLISQTVLQQTACIPSKAHAEVQNRAADQQDNVCICICNDSTAHTWYRRMCTASPCTTVAWSSAATNRGGHNTAFHGLSKRCFSCRITPCIPTVLSAQGDGSDMCCSFSTKRSGLSCTMNHSCCRMSPTVMR